MASRLGGFLNWPLLHPRERQGAASPAIGIAKAKSRGPENRSPRSKLERGNVAIEAAAKTKIKLGPIVDKDADAALDIHPSIGTWIVRIAISKLGDDGDALMGADIECDAAGEPIDQSSIGRHTLALALHVDAEIEMEGEDIEVHSLGHGRVHIAAKPTRSRLADAPWGSHTRDQREPRSPATRAHHAPLQLEQRRVQAIGLLNSSELNSMPRAERKLEPIREPHIEEEGMVDELIVGDDVGLELRLP